jgi:transposase-like protein
MSQLTTTQEQVLTLLAQGSTVAAAAREAGIHRNTIGNWRRTYPEFQDFLAAAQFDLALYWREQLLAFGDRAIQTLDRIFSDENESSGVQLRAAMAVLEKLMKPGPAQPELAARRRQQQPPVETHPSATNPPIRHKRTLHDKPDSGHPDAATQPRPNRTKLHNAPPEPGRNALCPCGSGLKYKRCCLTKSELQAHAA